MRLKHLKLNGFKSFVDTTLIPFPTNLVAVVGPNGCGKSNIIDAVRWVMGESSAKSLRGESMTDVIFNGSSQRKASGQASVELLFDNSMGRLEGAFGSYQEIAVKRVVSRDGDSSYFINNQRCRRRDVTDMFLGTGAGARGYSIISQGTVSQMIEARPEELRAHLEEAAGISKYKERRRETLSRMEQTRENLQRLNDITQELDKQLNRLERQAKNAELYRTLSQKRRETRMGLLALKWQQLEDKRLIEQQNLHTLYAQIHEHKSQRASIINERSSIEQQYQQQEALVQTWQEAFYQLAADIARTEESLKQTRQQQEERTHARQQLANDIQLLNEQIKKDQHTLNQCIESLLIKEKMHPEKLSALQTSKQALQKLQQQQNMQRQKELEARQNLQNAQHQVQLNEVRLDQLKDKRQHLLINAEKFSLSHYSDELHTCTQKLQTLHIQLEHNSTQVVAQEAELANIKEARKSLEQSFHTTRQELSSLETLIQKNLREKTILSTKINAFSNDQNISQAVREWQKNKHTLLSSLKVETEWQEVFEWIFQDALTAFLLENDDELPETAILLRDSGVSVCTARNHKENPPPDTLAAKISGPVPCWPVFFEQIYLTDNFENARTMLKNLSPECSVLSKDGFWIGHGWLKSMVQSTGNTVSLLSLQEQLKTVEQQLAEQQNNKILLENKKSELDKNLHTNHAQIEDLQQQVLISKETQHRHKLEWEQQKAQKSHLQKTIETIHAERSQLSEDIETVTADLLEAEAAWQTTKDLLVNARIAHENCLQDSQSSEHIITEQQRLTTLEKEFQTLSLEIETLRQQKQQTELNIEREQQRCAVLQERLLALDCPLKNTSTDEKTLQTTLEDLQNKQQENTIHLREARTELERLHIELQRMNKLVEDLEALAQQAEKRSQTHQLGEQELAVRAKAQIENLEEMDSSLEQARLVLQDDWDIAFCERQLTEYEQKISRLGAINLAAIDEYQTEKERRDRLDKETQDLSEALKTLEEAIAKIDKETRIRLQETFDAVNSTFQQLFPRLFGGGKAMLQLTDDNLLDAGIMVMAQPPGKRNSRIQLLSGGEKAMTAVALVFAIFQLNPSPFCMLDEVDAPLDDANVGRFCELVREMSQVIQFLFITHNKVTMEMADQLIGITMREPGVSRMVSVDMEYIPSS